MGFRFSQYELIEKPLELWCGDKRINASKCILETLAYLVERRGEVVTKQDLFENVWQGRIVTDAAIAKRIEKVRRMIGECGSNPRFIQTIYGRGFIFEGNVTVTGNPCHDISEGALAPTEFMNCTGNTPVVAVLSFSSRQLSADEASLADGLATDIITALASVNTLRVIARASSFQFESLVTCPRQVRVMLGGDYSLCGEVRKSDAGYTIEIELSETGGETIVWANQFGIDEYDVHSVREGIVARIVSQTEVAIRDVEASRRQLSKMSKSASSNCSVVTSRL